MMSHKKSLMTPIIRLPSLSSIQKQHLRIIFNKMGYGLIDWLEKTRKRMDFFLSHSPIFSYQQSNFPCKALSEFECLLKKFKVWNHTLHTKPLGNTTFFHCQQQRESLLSCFPHLFYTLSDFLPGLKLPACPPVTFFHVQLPLFLKQGEGLQATPGKESK